MTEITLAPNDIQNLHSQGERVTPLIEIPPPYRKEVIVSNDRRQIIDTRRCYTFHPEYRDENFPNGAYLECIDLAVDEMFRK